MTLRGSLLSLVQSGTARPVNFPSYDPLQDCLTRGATELLVTSTFLRRVLRWLALLPEGVRHELLRRELVEHRKNFIEPSATEIS